MKTIGVVQTKGRYIKVQTNCGCGSGWKWATANQIKRWMFGPRCPTCGKILGWMEWNTTEQRADKEDRMR